MIKVQEDLIFFYNEMTKYSSELPIGVKYDLESKVVKFSQYNITSNFSLLNNYCKDLKNLTDTAILYSEDYVNLMTGLKKLIESGKLLDERILISPVKYGFVVYESDQSALEFGPLELANIRIISTNNWIHRFLMKLKYKLIIR